MDTPGFLRSILPVAPRGIGPNLITDGGFEIWTSATNLTYWSENISGTSTVNREASVIHSGVYSCRLDIDASNNYVQILHDFGGIRAGLPYRVSFWYKTASGRTACALLTATYAGSAYYLQPDGSWKKSGDPDYTSRFVTDLSSTEWAQCTVDFIASPGIDNALGVSLYLTQRSAASSSVYFDDVSLNCLLPEGAMSLWVPGSVRTASGPAIAGRATDILRNNNGQASGLVTPSPDGLGWKFDGATGSILVANNTPLSHDNFSVGTWALADSAPAAGGIFMGYNHVSYTGWNLFLTPGLVWAFQLYFMPTGGSLVQDVISVSTKKWYFIVATCDKSTTTERLYRDGVLRKTVATAGYSKSVDRPIYIGRRADDACCFFPGSLALPFYISRVLSDQEIANLYNATKGFFYPGG